MTTTVRLFVACVLIVETAALCYGTLMAWLLSIWFLDDTVVAAMQPADWWTIAAERVVICAAVALPAAICILVVNRWLARVAGQTSSRWPLVTAGLFAALPVGASLTGALQFGITKPYM
ncbi:MAG: hypothetical protein QOH21_458 [Acidobacteriota bacterium]|nr:hypothetical protein [Acidobacteriota bacterium]